MHRIFLRKTAKEKRDENPKLPYFTLVLIPEGENDEGGEWQEVGALWPAKSGNGYSGKTNDGVEITVEKKEKPKKKSVDMGDGPGKGENGDWSGQD